MANFKTVSLRLAVGALALTNLSACREYLDLPTPMPSGYTYHADLYKSPPSPEADDIGYTYSPAENEKIMKIWQTKAEEVLQAFHENTGTELDIVFIAPPSLDSAQNYSLDHSLREALRKQGVRLATRPEDILTLEYEISRVPDEDAPPVYPRAERIENHPASAPYENYEPMVVEVRLKDGRQLVTKSSNVHILPMFGYRRDYHNGIHFYDSITGGYTPNKTME